MSVRNVYLQARIEGDKLIISNISNEKILLKSILIKYYITAENPVEEKQFRRTVSEEKKIDAWLDPGNNVQIPLTIPEVKEVSVIFSTGLTTLRQDIEL